MSNDSNGKERVYNSIFLDKNWAHQKYYGWRVVQDQPGLRVLRKRRAVFSRSLILLTREGLGALDHAVKKERSRVGLAEIVIHDFDNTFAKPPNLAGVEFRCAEQKERLLNIATMAIDLTQDETEILAGMSSDYRRKIKKAKKNEVVVTPYPRPETKLQNAFSTGFKKFAKERNLRPFDPGTLARMYENGDGVLFVARKAGQVVNYLHIYRSQHSAIFMYGLNLSKQNDGAGQYLHWKAICYLKENGLSWYDLGGVASSDPADGIYNFKKKFGAPVVSLGAEWISTGSLIRTSKALVEGMRELTDRQHQSQKDIS